MNTKTTSPANRAFYNPGTHATRVTIRFPDGYHASYSDVGHPFLAFAGELNDSEPWPGNLEPGPQWGEQELFPIPADVQARIARMLVEPVVQLLAPARLYKKGPGELTQ